MLILIAHLYFGLSGVSAFTHSLDLCDSACFIVFGYLRLTTHTYVHLFLRMAASSTICCMVQLSEDKSVFIVHSTEHHYTLQT